MPKVLVYDGRPIAIIELLPNNALDGSPGGVQGELCSRLSPNEGSAGILEITDAEAEALRRGEVVPAVAESGEEDDEYLGD